MMEPDPRFAPLLARIDQLLEEKSQILLAIDGDCASGKSTLAAGLEQKYDGNVLPMDHFFLPPERRTAARLAEPGGNVDYERFLVEVLTPLKSGQTFFYRPFDCRSGDYGDEVAISPRRLNIIEGSYSQHPALVDAYHIKVFLTVPEGEQLRRIRARDGAELAKRFKAEWIPMEKRYFAHFEIESQCDFVV